MDNLSTHKAASLYKAFPAAQARRILRRLEFHYTPKHASWLNMVEIEIGNMNQQCLDRRIPDWDTLAKDLAAWETRRNEAKASINWMFKVEDARSKLGRAYNELNPSNALRNGTRHYELTCPTSSAWITLKKRSTLQTQSHN
jgi:hypothetical protein